MARIRLVINRKSAGFSFRNVKRLARGRAKTNTRAATTRNAKRLKLTTAEAMYQAPSRPFLERWRVKMGIKAEDIAPITSKLKIRLGMRSAAK